jgi:hypothetical protein
VRVSVASGGVQANAESHGAALSANGDCVAFASRASNLVAGDTNGMWDVFVHALQTGATTRVSIGPGGLQANQNSGFHEIWYSLVVLNISSDGRYVAFGSGASNLVPGDTNGAGDSFVRDSVVPTATPTVTGTPPTPTPTHTATATATPVPTSTPGPTAVCEPPRPAEWSPIAPLPTVVRGPGVTSDGITVCAVGGYSDGASGPVGQVARYDVQSNTWTPLAPMLDPAYAHAVVYVEDKLYVIGGIGDSSYLNSTRIYDIDGNTWSWGSPMPEHRVDLMAGYYDGQIYVVGGVDNYGTMRK